MNYVPVLSALANLPVGAAMGMAGRTAGWTPQVSLWIHLSSVSDKNGLIFRVTTTLTTYIALVSSDP